MRLGADDLNAAGATMDDAVEAISLMKEHGPDLADISAGFNTPDMDGTPLREPSGFLSRALRVKREVGIPVGVSWNLGVPADAEKAVQDGLDLVFLGRPALANPHWPVWAARELGRASPFDLVPEDCSWWLKDFRGHSPSIGWPEVAPAPAAAGGPIDLDAALPHQEQRQQVSA